VAFVKVKEIWKGRGFRDMEVKFRPEVNVMRLVSGFK
jgi:hypothetical protein